MPPRNGNKSTKNSNRNKGHNKEPQPAVRNASEVLMQTRSSCSPSRDDKLPENKKTKTKTSTRRKSTSPENVSDLSFTFMDGISDQNLITKENSEGITVNSKDSHVLMETTITHVRASHDVSDNEGTPFVDPTLQQQISLQESLSTEHSEHTHPLTSSPEDPWHLTYNELKIMRSRMGTLEKVEAATLDFARQLQSLTGKTTATEKKVSNNTTKIKEMGKEILELRATVEKQQSTIQSLQKLKEDFKNISHKNISEMNSLVEQQREQVETIRVLKQDIKTDAQTQKEQLQAFQTSQVETIKVLKRDIKSDAQNQKEQLQIFQTSQEANHTDLKQQITQIKDDTDHKFLLDEAFKKRHNLVIIGLPENEASNTFSVVINFLKTQLKVKKRIQIYAAYRMGRVPQDGHPYIRPIMVKFSNLADRNLIWKMRNDIIQNDEQTKVKIQADLPKLLRDNAYILYRVVEAASSMDDFKTAMVKDFAVVLHGKHYTVDKLELLPPPIRPSSLAIRESDEALIFFSKFCFLSNHFPSKFTCDGNTFHNMEQYLAFRKAELSQQDDIIKRALHASDPVEAKSILNFLRKDFSEQWGKIREEASITGLREKFRQNKHLADLLRDTRQLRLGEASKDPCWGIGFTLDDQQALDMEKWNKQGNLLGNALMQIRSELSSTKAKRT